MDNDGPFFTQIIRFTQEGCDVGLTWSYVA